MDLTDRQVVAFFKENFPHIRIDIPDLRDLKPETVEKCLIALLSAVYGLEDNFFANDDYEPQRRLVILVSLMQRTVDDVQKDFDIVFNATDLIYPQPARIRTFLGLLINFYKFVCQQTEFIDSVFEEVASFEQKQAEVQQSIDNLQSIYDRELELAEQDELAIAELTQEQAVAGEEFCQLTSKKEECKAEAVRLEERINAMTATVAELESTVNEHRIESDNLNDEIIGNPEQLFADIDHAKSELKNTNESVAHFKRQLREQEHLRREADAIRDKLHAAHAEFAALIKTNLDRVSKCRADAAEALEALKQKETRVLAMQREHDEFRAQCDIENLTLRDSIKVGEEKILSVCRQSDTYLQNAEELERYDFAVDEKAKTAHLKQVRDVTAQVVEEKKAYIKRCLKKENALQDKVIDVENRYNHLVKFVDKCVSNVENYPGLMEIQKAQAYISELENKKMKLQKRVNNNVD